MYVFGHGCFLCLLCMERMIACFELHNCPWICRYCFWRQIAMITPTTPKLLDWVNVQRQPLPDFPGGGAKMTANEVLFQPAEVVIPAAVENQITSENAHRLQGRILCEGANGPSTAMADEIVDRKGIFVIPDILANAGGVTVSYFEWVQDRQGYFWSEKEVNDRLKDVIEHSFDEVVRYAETHQVNNRVAGYMLGIDRVAFALKERGIYA